MGVQDMHTHAQTQYTCAHTRPRTHAHARTVHACARTKHTRSHTHTHSVTQAGHHGGRAGGSLGVRGCSPRTGLSQTVPTTTPPAHARCGQRARRSYLCKVLIRCRSRKRYKTLAVCTIVPRNHAVPALPRVLPRPQLLMFQLFYDLTVFPPDRPNSNTIAFTIHWFLVCSWSRATSTRI